MSSPTLLNRLTFRQLQVFQAVHRQRSYSRAAEQLGLTQPAVSAQMRQLEQAVGQPLFKYAGKTLHALPAQVERRCRLLRAVCRALCAG